MNKNKYKNLLQSSTVFRTFDPSLKNHVLNASGGDQARYADILLSAEDLVSAAAQDLSARNEEVVSDAKHSVKKIEKEKVLSAEKKSLREEKKAEAELLEQLKKA